MAEAEAGLTRLYGKIVTGTSGVITSQECDGFTIVKTVGEVGRYTVNLHKKYEALRICNVMIQGADDTSPYTISRALDPLIRQVDVNKDIPLFYIQFVYTRDPQEDRELQNNAIVFIEIVLKNVNVPDRSKEIPISTDLSDIHIDQLPDDTEANRQIKEALYRLTDKLKEIFDYYENNIGDLQ